MTNNEKEKEIDNFAAVIRETIQTLKLRKEFYETESNNNKFDKFSKISAITTQHDIELIEYYLNKYCNKKNT